MAYITDEAFRGSIGDLRLFQKPGLETLKRLIRNELPGPPITRLFGLHPTEAGLGKATFAMPVNAWLGDGFGLYWGGIYALFADAPLGFAILTTLPSGKAVATSELSMSFIRPMNVNTTNLVGRAETIHSGNQVGLSMIQITDQEGRLMAFGSTRCLITDVPVNPEEVYPPPDTGPDKPVDPYLRPPPDDGYFSFDQVMNWKPIELQKQAARGEKIFPVLRLTGYRLTSVEEGHTNAVIPSSPWFANGSPVIYGGLLAWAAEFTMGTATYSTLSAGDVFATLDMHIRFTRPASINSGDLSLSSYVRHRGKRLRVTSCEIDNAEGKRVAMATSSALVVRGGVRELKKGRLPEEILADISSGQGAYPG